MEANWDALTIPLRRATCTLVMSQFSSKPWQNQSNRAISLLSGSTKAKRAACLPVALPRTVYAIPAAEPELMFAMVFSDATISHPASYSWFPADVAQQLNPRIDVVMRVVTGDAAFGDLLQLCVFRRGVNNER